MEALLLLGVAALACTPLAHPLTHTLIVPVCRLEALLRAMEAKMALLARQLSDCEAHRRKFEVQGV